MKPRHWLFLFLLALTAARYLIIGRIELSPDESYYYLWAQHPDWNYYSKGPGVAMVIRAGTALFGANEFGVRFFSPLFALGTSLVLFYFARRLYGEQVGVWTVVAMNLMPMLQVGGMVMTIDPLSIFFWASALLTFWIALERSPRFSFYWPVTGLLIGAGFLSKYTNAAQLLSILLVLGSTMKLRREFARPGFWTMLACFAPCVIPVIWWNAQHDWITWIHLLSRGGFEEGPVINPSKPFEFAGSLAAVYSPLIFAGMLAALWWGWQRARTQFRPRFLVLFSLPILIFYTLLSFHKAGQPNWSALAFVSLGVLATALWFEGARTSRFKARFALCALGLGLIMSLTVINTDLVRWCGVPWSYDADPGQRLRGWKSAAEAVGTLRKNFEHENGTPVFLIGNKYQTSSILSFYLTDQRVEGAGHPPIYIPESQMIENQFSFWPRYDEFVAAPPGTAKPADSYYTEEQGVNLFAGRTAFYISDDDIDFPPRSIQNSFERVELIATWRFERHGLRLRVLRVFACHRYHNLPL